MKTDHHEYILSKQDALEMTEQYLQDFDEPFADTSSVPTMLVSKMARKSVTVALTGDGGDELFLGYGAYKWAGYLSNPAIRVLRPLIKNVLQATPSNKYKRVSHLFENVTPQQLRSHIFSQEQYFFSSREIENELLIASSAYRPFTYSDEFSYLSESEKQALFDFHFYLKDDLLVKVDRASMRFSLECRCPLLDHRVVDLAFSLPVAFKKNNGVDKWILKKQLEEYLPKDLIYRPKWGFSVPLASWLRGDLRYLIDTYLNDQLVNEVGLFRASYINELKRRFFSGKEEYLYNRLWVIILVHKWLKQHG